MKTNSLIIVIVVAICSFLFSSCKKEPAPLKMEGVWTEITPSHYNDSVNYSKIDMILNCNLSFKMDISSYHSIFEMDSSLNDSVYHEYIKGEYETTETTLKFIGNYYTNNDYTILADSTNTSYAFGKFDKEYTYQIDDKHLTLDADNPINEGVKILSQTAPYDCYY